MKLYDGKPASPLTSDCEIKNIYDLVPKGAQMGVGFLTVNKIRLKHFVLLLLCVCVHRWSVSQWKQYELQI